MTALSVYSFTSLKRRERTSAREKGLVTLLTSVVILLLATIFVISVSKTSLIELRISANEIRAKQAFTAAEAGISTGAAYIVSGTPKGADKVDNATPSTTTPDGVADELAVAILASGTQNSFSVAFCDPTQTTSSISCPSAPGAVVCTRASTTYFRTPLLVACGWSDDGTGRAMITQGMGTIAGLSNAPTNALTAKGAVNVTGSASVINQYNNLTIWTGQALNVTSATGKTFVRNPALDPLPSSVAPPARTALPSSCQNPGTDFVCTTNSTSKGPDVIDLDPTLSNLTNAQLFANYFGVDDVAAFQSQKASLAAVDPADVGDLAGISGEVLVISGDVDGMPNATIGTRDQPVILVIDGNWSGAGNTLIYGVVYVRGNVNLTGSVDIYGAAVVEGQVAGTGGLNIVFDPMVTSNAASKIGKPGMIPGSWRDWRI